MKMKKLYQRLTKVMSGEMDTDGYVRIDSITLYADGMNVTIAGQYGTYADGDVKYYQDFKLTYPDGSSLEFIAGMFYQLIQADGNI